MKKCKMKSYCLIATLSSIALLSYGVYRYLNLKPRRFPQKPNKK